MKNRLNKTALSMVAAGHSIAFDSNGIALLDMLQPSNTVLSALDTAAKFGDAATVVCSAARECSRGRECGEW